MAVLGMHATIYVGLGIIPAPTATGGFCHEVFCEIGSSRGGGSEGFQSNARPIGYDAWVEEFVAQVLHMQYNGHSASRIYQVIKRLQSLRVVGRCWIDATFSSELGCQQIVELHLLTEKQLRNRIEQARTEETSSSGAIQSVSS